MLRWIGPVNDLPQWTFGERFDEKNGEWVICGYGPAGTPIVCRSASREEALVDAATLAENFRLTLPEDDPRVWNAVRKITPDEII